MEQLRKILTDVVENNSVWHGNTENWVKETEDPKTHFKINSFCYHKPIFLEIHKSSFLGKEIKGIQAFYAIYQTFLPKIVYITDSDNYKNHVVCEFYLDEIIPD
jgi:hypothetical protein